MRPIINLKGLNTFVETVHFKMEGIHMLRDSYPQARRLDDKVDLKDAYDIYRWHLTTSASRHVYTKSNDVAINHTVLNDLNYSSQFLDRHLL